MNAIRILALSALVAVVAASPGAAQRPPRHRRHSCRISVASQATDTSRSLTSTVLIGTKWNFEWDVPEGPLGPEGTVKA